MWNNGASLLGNHSLELTPIQQIVDRWPKKEFQNNILNRIWDLLPGFVVWEIWKERNTHIFEGKTRKLEEYWTLIHTHIKETLGLRKWDTQALRARPKETLLLRIWEIISIPEYIGIPGHKIKGT